jgi:hypothetical protein
MKIKRKIFARYLIPAVALVFIFYSCSINEPTAPRWDVSLNVPIAKKHYTMYDIVEKKSAEINHYTDGSNKNILYYTNVNVLDQIDVNDKLKIDAFSESTSKEIGTISIAPDSIQTDIAYSWIGFPVTPGSQIILPAANNTPITVPFNSVQQFQSAAIESGIVELFITNHMPAPVSITMSNLSITNTNGGELIVNGNSSATISSQQTVKVSTMHVVPGVTAKNNLTLNCNISNTSSGGATITLPANSLTVKAVLKNINVTQAVGKIPEQNPVVVNGLVTVEETSSQPTKFKNVVLDNGTLNLTLTNNLDIDASATIKIYNLKNPQGAMFTATRTIQRKQAVKVFDNFSLRDYSIVSTDGTPTNQVSYDVSFQSLASVDYRTIKSTDDVVGDVSFSNLQIKEFSGQLKPTLLENTRTSVSLNVKDLQNKLQFQQINLKNPIVELRLKPTAQVEFSIDGRMEARNSLGQKSTMTLSARTLNKTIITPTDTVVTLNPDSVSNFFKKFSKFPDSLIVYAGGVVNPNYKIVNVKKTDRVAGKSRIEFPLIFGISGGEITDSVNVDLSNDDRDKIKDLNSFDAALKITNGIAANVAFTGRLYDEYNNFLMYFPPKHADQDTVITVSGATTDADGNVVTKKEQTIKVKTSGGEPEKLSRAKYMRVRLKFSTSGQNNTPVKFKTDDTIDISVSGSVNYQVKK